MPLEATNQASHGSLSALARPIIVRRLPVSETKCDKCNGGAKQIKGPTVQGNLRATPVQGGSFLLAVLHAIHDHDRRDARSC